MSWLTDAFTGAKSTSQNYITPQKTWLQKMLAAYGPEMGEGADVYGGTRVAPMTATQQQATDLSGWAQHLQPGNMPMYGEAGQALGGLLGGTMGAEPWTQGDVNTLVEAAYKPVVSNWESYGVPMLRENANMPGGGGLWSRDLAVTQQAKESELANEIAAQKATLGYAAQGENKAMAEARAGRALSAIQPSLAYGMAPTTQVGGAAGAMQDIYAAGTPAQVQQQAEINAAVQKFAEENQLTDPQDLAILMQLLGISYTKSTSTQPSPFASAFGKTLGKGAGGATLAGAGEVLSAIDL